MFPEDERLVDQEYLRYKYVLNTYLTSTCSTGVYCCVTQSMHMVPLEGKTCIIKNSCLRCINVIVGSGSLDAQEDVQAARCNCAMSKFGRMRRVFMLQLFVATSASRSTLKQLVASLASAHGMW